MKENGQPDYRTVLRTNFADRRFRIPFLAVAVWSAAIVVSVILTAAVRIDTALLPYALTAIAVLAGTWFFARKVFLEKKASAFLPFRKYAGYMAVVLYMTHAIPRLSWQSSERIGSGTALYLFIVSMVLVAIAVWVFFTLRNLKTQVYWGVISEKEAKDKKLRKHNAATRTMTPAGKVFDWVDAFLQAAILVILINTFIIQIYAIPSESMVPTFLIKDRPVTLKFLSGPAFPFSEYRLPVLKKPSRGDVIVLRNPRYDEGRDILKQQASRLVFMLTFSLVNPDRYDELGREKADPLVKRLIALPGEKIMMRDDRVYLKTAADEEFHELEVDTDNYSQVDLYSQPEDIRTRIRRIPITAKIRTVLNAWDVKKNDTETEYFERRIPELFAALEAGIQKLTPADLERFNREIIRKAYPDPVGELAETLGEIKKDTSNRFTDWRVYNHELLHFREILSGGQALSDLRAYALSWLETRTDSSLYARDTRIMSLFFKENLLRLFVRDLELLESGVNVQEFASDSGRAQILRETGELHTYVFGYFDPRNFPEFPEGEGNYIPEGHYFPMGDNRYNSIDFRHRMDSERRPFDRADPVSIEYESSIEPLLLPERNLEGFAVWRIWPLSHFGAVE